MNGKVLNLNRLHCNQCFHVNESILLEFTMSKLMYDDLMETTLGRGKSKINLYGSSICTHYFKHLSMV